MKAEFLTDAPFPGWPEFTGELLKFAPVDALWHIQNIIVGLCEQTDGIFLGVAPVYPTNVHVVIREYVAKLPEPPLPAPSAIDRKTFYPMLTRSCRQINRIRNQHPALNSTLILSGNARYEQHFRKLWFHHLEQYGMNWSPKYEMARSQRMFSEIWAELSGSGKVKLKSHTSTSFLDGSYRLLLSLGLWRHGGRVDDVRELMSKSGLGEAQLRPMLETSCLPLSKVQDALAKSPKYPNSIDNFFYRYPLIRTGEWSVVAPMPNLILQGWDLQNLFEGLECARGNAADDRGGVEYYRALGVVYEAYVKELLAELVKHSADSSLLHPFKYKAKTQVDSPDGFIIGKTGTLAFEAKCYRVPHSAYEDVLLPGFLSWFANLLGTNDKGRKPMAQGASFFEEYQKNNADLAGKLPPFDMSKILYIIVSYDDLPMFSHWSIFRRWYKSQHLEAHTHDLWAKTLVISIRELEVLVAAAQSAGQTGGPPTPFDPFLILKEYSKYCQDEPDVDPVNGFKNSLRNWLLEKYPASGVSMPSILSEANRRLFDRAIELGFPESSELAAEHREPAV